MVNMMKALVFTAPHTFEYRDVPRPEPAPDEVLVEVKACAICGSDVHGSSGENGRRIPPLVMGHEASGTIAQLGEAVQSWAVGDRVTLISPNTAAPAGSAPTGCTTSAHSAAS